MRVLIIQQQMADVLNLNQMPTMSILGSACILRKRTISPADSVLEPRELVLGGFVLYSLQ